MASIRTTAANRFDTFNVYTTFFKKIGDHEIEVNVIVPKDIKPGKHPLLVKWHGGGLCAGTAMYPDWFAAFFIPLIHRNNAITIAANHRLMPEHNGDEILEDLEDFWTWTKNELPAYLASKNSSISVDFDHVFVSGESAGAYMALQSPMVLPKGSIKAVLVQYPLLTYVYSDPKQKFLGMPCPPKELILAHLDNMKPDAVVTRSDIPDRLFLPFGLGAYGLWKKYFGEAKHLMPIDRIEDQEEFPPTWIFHAENDSIVNIDDSRQFVSKVKKFVPNTPIYLHSPSTGDHGFDCEYHEDDHPWLKEALTGVEKAWLA